MAKKLKTNKYSLLDDMKGDTKAYIKTFEYKKKCCSDHKQNLVILVSVGVVFAFIVLFINKYVHLPNEYISWLLKRTAEFSTAIGGVTPVGFYYALHLRYTEYKNAVTLAEEHLKDLTSESIGHIRQHDNLQNTFDKILNQRYLLWK